MPTRTYSLEESYNHCRKIALAHYENFPVGSILIPKKIRPHFFALYAFMRSADDFADLPGRNTEERLALLTDWRRQLEYILSTEYEYALVGRTLVRPDSADGLKSVPLSSVSLEPAIIDPIFIALRNTIAEYKLSPSPFYRLLEAFEFDARGDVHFETFEDLRWYTARSADPVGELVLALFGYNDEKRIRLSNEICTGLQLLNFIQDIKEDLSNQRYYYPLEDVEIFGVDLKIDTIDSDRINLLSLFEIDRVESLIDRGARLAESVRGRLRYELRAVIFAARKMIKKARKAGGNTYIIRPKLSKWEHLMVLLQSILLRAK